MSPPQDYARIPNGCIRARMKFLIMTLSTVQCIVIWIQGISIFDLNHSKALSVFDIIVNAIRKLIRRLCTLIPCKLSSSHESVPSALLPQLIFPLLQQRAVPLPISSSKNLERQTHNRLRITLPKWGLFRASYMENLLLGQMQLSIPLLAWTARTSS
ncbi:hypothetical protein L211DRAFT_851603 [Terfezia boudieri ATCC MYA-4762]|uniref:Uncharacterized protein n=1 Tax=Terfezia boudieri ATCC MYA-4762 TaxID=1051890 RepID=A0A3N4LEC8_9PEZI|nr:hypothetical protein L211DRAFT_851603 [Terfezia boudieri ATCC MYA-4762]